MKEAIGPIWSSNTYKLSDVTCGMDLGMREYVFIKVISPGPLINGQGKSGVLLDHVHHWHQHGTHLPPSQDIERERRGITHDRAIRRICVRPTMAVVNLPKYTLPDGTTCKVVSDSQLWFVE